MKNKTAINSFWFKLCFSLLIFTIFLNIGLHKVKASDNSCFIQWYTPTQVDYCHSFWVNAIWRSDTQGPEAFDDGPFETILPSGSCIPVGTNIFVILDSPPGWDCDLINKNGFIAGGVSLLITAPPPPQYTLQVSKNGTGSGTVDFNPPIATTWQTLPASQSYNSGTVVTLTAQASAGSTFAGWTGDADCSDGSVTMSAARNCIANFNATAATANIKANNSDGPITINAGDSVDITWQSSASATSCRVDPPNWTGTTGLPGAHTLNLSAGVTYRIYCDPPVGGPEDDYVVVNVLLQTFNLNVIKSGRGTVLGVSNPAQVNINCGTSLCQTTYTLGTAVVLTAIPDPGRIFTGWGGACSGMGTCSVTIDGPKTVNANFAIDPNFKEF